MSTALAVPHSPSQVLSLPSQPSNPSSASTTPDLSDVDDRGRSLSQTTLCTFYSMYDNGEGARDVSNAVARDCIHQKRFSETRSSTDDLPRFDPVSLTNKDFLGAIVGVNGFQIDFPPSTRRPPKTPDHHPSLPRRSTSSTSTVSESASFSQNRHHRRPHSRPPTPPRGSPYCTGNAHGSDQPRCGPECQKLATSHQSLSRKPVHSVHDSTELPPIPIIALPTRSSSRSAIAEPPPSSSNLNLMSPPSRSAQPLPSSASSKVSPTPSSRTSIVPSDGEDYDAFYVRTTYAQLDASGVEGDGYLDGVERTRSHVGAGKSSQINLGSMDGHKSGDLDPEELDALAGLDRYGFFDVPSHDRLVLLPAAHFRKRFSRVSAGPPSATPNPIICPSIPSAPPPMKESSRIGKWTRMLVPVSRDLGNNIQTWGIRPSKVHKLRERVYKGVPDRWRTAVWELLVSHGSQSGVEDVMKLEAAYVEDVEKPSKYDVQIDLDVPRTISGHVMFKTRYGAGQRSLFHVLHAFSLHCTPCGYVQGMGPIAATLLCYTSPAHVYATIARLHSHPFYDLHSIFSPGFPGLLEAIFVQERIVESLMPDVFESFKDKMISSTSYATKWYITLFANSVPFQLQLRLWDVFLLEGKDLFIVVAVAIIWAFRDYITSSSASFETVLSLLSSFFVPENENALLAWIERTLSDRKLRANIVRWRSEWQGLVTNGKEGTALL